jgi:catechol 2,3-dioxygenase-like lactoylglutathione lyase family enzyme
MKRFHVHVVVQDLEATVRFYSSVFGAPPTVHKPDYAKWMLEDPRVNFAVSKQTGSGGIDHLGIQVDSGEELAALREQATGAQIAAQDQAAAECCYAQSDKYWITDPQGIAWETFHTLESIPVRGKSSRPDASSCCGKSPSLEAPADKSSPCCA